MTNLPGLNYDSKLSIDDLAFEAESTEEAILDRIRLTFGTDSLASPRSGILDAVDPKDLVSDETTRPLIVYPSTNDPLKVNVADGTAVNPNGTVVRNPSLLEDFELARTTPGDVVVVYIINQIIDAEPVRKTRFNTDQYVRRVQDTSVIGSSLLSDFNNSVLFTPDILDSLTVIAVVTVVETVSGTALQIDYTNSTYSFNRPWFSPVDIEHRSRIGSGTATDNNPHAISYNDLVSGNLTLYDQILPVGVIQARDDNIKGVPGLACQETVTASRILIDTGGDMTQGSRFGGVGVRYIVLSKYPAQITGFHLQGYKGRAIAFDLIRGTKTVVLPPPENFTETAVIYYNEVFAGQPPAQILSNTLGFTQPDTDRELIYTGGTALSEFTNQFVAFDGSGPYPRTYTVFADSDGTLVRTPQPVTTTTIVLDDIGTAIQEVTESYFGPARLSVGLASANAVPTMSITIRLYGRDSENLAFTEDIAFDGVTWTPVPVPGIENPGQFVKTENVFWSFTDYQILSRTDDGPNSKIKIWAELETGTTLELNKLARLASVTWNGTAIADVRDLRTIVKSIPDPFNRFLAAAETAGFGGTAPNLVYSDDFSTPLLRDTTSGEQAATAATFQITVNNYVLIQAGDQILLPTGKTLTAIITGSPNRAVGQYLGATSDKDTRDDIILTVNDATFDSGFTASANAADNIVDMTADTTGARGNGPVTEPVEGSPGAILVEDSAGGIDGFGESFTPRHQDFVQSPIPNPAVYEVYGVRERYLSVPLGIDNKTDLIVILYGVPAPRDGSIIQLRARFAPAASEVWEPWVVVPGNGAVFAINRPGGITKIQLEIFGTASGFSLYEV
jgi:hypothetical protein